MAAGTKNTTYNEWIIGEAKVKRQSCGRLCKPDTVSVSNREAPSPKSQVNSLTALRAMAHLGLKSPVCPLVKHSLAPPPFVYLERGHQHAQRMLSACRECPYLRFGVLTIARSVESLPLTNCRKWPLPHPLQVGIDTVDFEGLFSEAQGPPTRR